MKDISLWKVKKPQDTLHIFHASLNRVKKQLVGRQTTNTINTTRNATQRNAAQRNATQNAKTTSHLPKKEPFLDRWIVSSSSHSSGLTDHRHLPIEKTNEFYRIWSSLLFVFCDNATGHAIYGDGFFWSGTVIVYLLGQRKRLEVCC